MMNTDLVHESLLTYEQLPLNFHYKCASRFMFISQGNFLNFMSLVNEHTL